MKLGTLRPHIAKEPLYSDGHGVWLVSWRVWSERGWFPCSDAAVPARSWASYAGRAATAYAEKRNRVERSINLGAVR